MLRGIMGEGKKPLAEFICNLSLLPHKSLRNACPHLVVECVYILAVRPHLWVSHISYLVSLVVVVTVVSSL